MAVPAPQHLQQHQHLPLPNYSDSLCTWTLAGPSCGWWNGGVVEPNSSGLPRVKSQSEKGQRAATLPVHRLLTMTSVVPMRKLYGVNRVLGVLWVLGSLHGHREGIDLSGRPELLHSPCNSLSSRVCCSCLFLYLFPSAST